MSTKPRTPEHFPKMKHRAAKRRAVYIDIELIVTDIVAAFARLTARFEQAPPRCGHPNQQTTQAAPNRAAFLFPGEKP